MMQEQKYLDYLDKLYKIELTMKNSIVEVLLQENNSKYRLTLLKILNNEHKHMEILGDIIALVL